MPIITLDKIEPKQQKEMKNDEIKYRDISLEITYGNLIIEAALPPEALPTEWGEMTEEERREALDWGDFKFEFLGFDRGHEDFRRKVYDRAAGAELHF